MHNILLSFQVGVIGRTGSGKTTIMLTMFRFMELAAGCAFRSCISALFLYTHLLPTPPSGRTILVDNMDISRIQLPDLRSRISIIPQVLCRSASVILSWFSRPPGVGTYARQNACFTSPCFDAPACLWLPAGSPAGINTTTPHRRIPPSSAVQCVPIWTLLTSTQMSR